MVSAMPNRSTSAPTPVRRVRVALRVSVLATLCTALFLQTITSSLSFLSVSLAWQYWIQGILVVVAALVPLLRGRRRSRAVVALNSA